MAQSKDFLSQLRDQAEQTLKLLTAEIRKREVELDKLMEQARTWRDALASSFGVGGSTKPTRRRRTAKKTGARKKTASRKASTRSKKKKAKKRSGGARVDWDKVLASLPSTFTIDDVMKHPGARSKGREQVYPAINRWVNAKKARKVGTGRYKRSA